ncbi:hypothetical protein KOW79_008738 [Hemibagrus wyckioides]|uniref:CENP-T/Histone H4 histone fold domain-containing protein n=1 Tax=Hemibagrus wyckioides TaxID=337641 RepID=A0A9D3NRT3_9TELE|nr:glutamic acid-rich protein [Hemibagrus wyckioides]KAG7327132.1 hypothetical protein KOW79_008738 [Hemibagrus wyckioides]
MDSVEEEDVSARVLLRNVLHTETQRSPVTRSTSRNQYLSRVRRSSRLRDTPEMPHVALRHKLKQKVHESAAKSPLPPSKRARSQGRMLSTPAVLPSPALYDDDVTPRGLLRGIIQTEAEASLLLSSQTAVPQADQQDVEASIHSNRRSDGMSGLELPDLATEPLTHVIRGMSRRRPPPTFNVSVFEKQLDQPSGEEEEMEVSQENSDVSKEQDLSAGSKSVLSLTLKTPFVSLPSERAGLMRRAAGRRKQLSVDAFDQAVQKRLERQDDQDYTVVQDGRTLQDSAWQKFTLGLSNVTVPEITTDMMMSNTELYAHPQSSESELRDADGGVLEGEMKRDDGDGDVREELQDQEKVCDSNISKPQPDPSEHLEPDSLSQEEEDEVEMISPSQEKDATSLSPEDIPFAPTQAIVECVSQPQEQEESLIPEAQLEEMDQRDGESRAYRRAYRSEGGAIRRGVMAGARGTKSLGMAQDPTEKQLQSFAPGTELEELTSMEEEPNLIPTSPSAVHATKSSSSETQQDSLVQNSDEEVVLDLDQMESQEVMVSVHVRPTVDFPAAEEEEQQQEEEEDEEWQQEMEEEEQHQEEEEEEQHQEEEEEEQHQEEEEEEQQQEEEEVQQEEELHQQHEEEEEEDAQSEELSMQTPGFIRQRKQVSTPGALATPTVLKALNAGPAAKAVKPRQKRQPRSAGVLPKSYVMSVFKHFAKSKVASDVYPVISDILQRYFDRLADDLEAYSAHAKRKTIEVEDVELLMRRQGFVTDSMPVNVLIEKFLPLEYRKLLIPVATSGNKVVPDQRR